MTSPVPHVSTSTQKGFTLVELMAVVAILGIMSALAVAAYTKNVRAAKRTQVIGDLSVIKLREHALFGVRGHYSTTAATETDTYPVSLTVLTEGDDAHPQGTSLRWNISEDGYTAEGASGEYFRGGEDEHGFDILNFMPENGGSMCVYGVITGGGTLNADFADVPPTDGLGAQVFPDTAPIYYARDWFYTFAKCDFDHDADYWEFTTAHFTSTVSDGTDGNMGE